MARKTKMNDGLYDATNKNHDILVLADKIGWKKAVKVKGMIARKLETDTVVSTFEGPVNGKAGSYLCRGIDTHDWWVQKEDAIMKKYNKDRLWKPEAFNGNTYSDFYLYYPKPDRAVLCCQIRRAFQVQAQWGLLSGKPGDYLVKPFEEELNPNPPDVWIVNKKLFDSTYKKKWFSHFF